MRRALSEYDKETAHRSKGARCRFDGRAVLRSMLPDL